MPVALLPGTFPDNRLTVPLAQVLNTVPDTWATVTHAFLRSDAGTALCAFVDRRVAEGANVYPAQVLRALALTAAAEVRVVILGQDPYHGAGQAQGLAFSVAPGQPVPPSLRNILKEVQTDTGKASQCRDDLSPWAAQGVLLLNSVLTVEQGVPHAHAARGWEVLTDALLRQVADRAEPVVFMLWGAAAQAKLPLLQRAAHRVLTANHPSPLSALRPPRAFIGCRHFSAANDFLRANRSGAAIRW